MALLNESYLRRIGSELHDGPAQDLGLSLLKLDDLLEQVEAHPQEKLDLKTIEQLATIEASLKNAQKEVRGIAAGLSLPQLSELSLADTVLRVIRTHEGKTGTKVALELESIDNRVALPLKITVYRLIQEALNNAYRHATGAELRVHVYVDEGQLVLEISDRGPGFHPEQVGEWDGHLGLRGMRERVESLGGKFEIRSQIGKGTMIIASLPCQIEGSGPV